MTATPAEIPARLAARAIDVALLVATAPVRAYFSLFDVLLGATPGKIALGLRVIGPDGGRPTLQQALARESFTVVGAVPLVGPVLALGAWVWTLLTIRRSPLRQGRHDVLAGGTRVVRA